VRRPLVGLDPEQKVRRAGLGQPFQSPGRGHPVDGVVEFDRAELLHVLGEHLLPPRAGRIERTHPVGKRVAARADAEYRCGGHTP